MMQNEKPSIKERFINILQKVKQFPKIWISALAIFSLAVGFIAGLAVNKRDQQTFERKPIGFTERGNRPRPDFREDRNSAQQPSDSDQVPNDDETDATSGASEKDSSQEANSQ